VPEAGVVESGGGREQDYVKGVQDQVLAGKLGQVEDVRGGDEPDVQD
jgi:hypothetical protein